MKRIFFLVLAVFFIFCASVYAHPPKEVILSYDASSRTLAVEVIHSSSDPNRHHINRLEVSVNGHVILEKTPNRQNNTRLNVAIPIPHVKSGDTVEVTAFCNRGGETSKGILIP